MCNSLKIVFGRCRLSTKGSLVEVLDRILLRYISNQSKSVSATFRPDLRKSFKSYAQCNSSENQSKWIRFWILMNLKLPIRINPNNVINRKLLIRMNLILNRIGAGLDGIAWNKIVYETFTSFYLESIMSIRDM